MKRTLIRSGFVALSVGLFAVSWVLAEMPTADPVVIWNYITKDAPYQKWSYWPDHQGKQPGRSPHGSLHRIYVNDRALNSAGPPLQHGSMVVMENYQGERVDLNSITVMYKLKGFNPPDGDWYWAKYTPEGQALNSGRDRWCIGCHSTRVKNDFVIVHDFK